MMFMALFCRHCATRYAFCNCLPFEPGAGESHVLIAVLSAFDLRGGCSRETMPVVAPVAMRTSISFHHLQTVR